MQQVWMSLVELRCAELKQVGSAELAELRWNEVKLN